MNTAKLTTLLILVMVLEGCNSRAPLSSQQSIPNDTVITLRRTICYGSCPDYTLTISADGTVTFEGRRFVKAPGTIKSNISREKLQQLILEFERADYFSLKDRYESKEDGCPAVWTDNPSAVTSIKIDGKSKTISHYYGCQENQGNAIYPKGLTELEGRIDEIVGTKQWIK